ARGGRRLLGAGAGGEGDRVGAVDEQVAQAGHALQLGEVGVGELHPLDEQAGDVLPLHLGDERLQLLAGQLVAKDDGVPGLPGLLDARRVLRERGPAGGRVAAVHAGAAAQQADLAAAQVGATLEADGADLAAAEVGRHAAEAPDVHTDLAAERPEAADVGAL